jgi:hypothetical protein
MPELEGVMARLGDLATPVVVAVPVLTERLRIDIAKMRALMGEITKMRKDGADDQAVLVKYQQYIQECVGFAGVITYLDEKCEIIVGFKEGM